MTPIEVGPRSLPRTHISRPRLLQRLSLAIQCKLTIICANAGYGKTTLVSDFIRTTGVQAEWHYLSTADRDAAQLAEVLESCLRRLAGRPEQEASRRSRARHLGAPGVAILAESLLSQAKQLGPEPVLLVLDDYHKVEDARDVNLLVASLIENSPPCLRIVILSRSAPHLPLARLKAQQEVSNLGEDDLAFTLEETSCFLQTVSDLQLADSIIDLVQQRSEGWAAGIAMVLQSLRYGRREKALSVLADPVASMWLVYDYLAEEVFDRQESAIQQFLVKTSILSRMDTDACDYLLDSTGSQMMLLSLEDQGLFTTSVDPARLTFRYHPLFREFLRQKLFQREPREAISQLNLRAAQFYERQEDWEASVHHYLKAGDPLKAAQVVESVGERYIFLGFSKTVEYWLQVLPEDITATRPWLLALKGRLSYQSVKLEEALRSLERAMWLFQANGDEYGQAWTAGEIAYVRSKCGRLRESIHHFSPAIAMAKNDASLRSQLLTMQAIAYRDTGMLDESIKGFQAAMREVAKVEDDSRRLWGQTRAARNMAVAQMEMGHLEAACRTLRQTLALCDDHQPGEFEEAWVHAELGAVLWALGDFEEAVRLLNRALTISGGQIKYQERFVGLWLGNALRDIGRISDAEKHYSLSTAPADLERIFLDVLVGRSLLVKASAIDLYNEHSRSESVVIKSTAEIVLSAVLRGCRDKTEALEHVKRGAELLRSHGHKQRLVSALFHQARLEYELLQPTNGAETLRSALDVASKACYYHFFWWDPDLIAFICQKALVEDFCTDYVVSLAVKRLDPTRVTTFSPLLQHHNADVRRRAEEILSSLCQQESANPQETVLAECGDASTRLSLLQAISEGVITSQGVRSLRASYGLSWREIDIFTEYYLRSVLESYPTGSALRKGCADRLCISEKTVRSHVNTIRRKLGLPSWVSGRRVLDWAEQEGVLGDRRP